MLGKVFARFVEKSPVSVMGEARGSVLGAEQLRCWFARTAQSNNPHLVVSTVYELLSKWSSHQASIRGPIRDREKTWRLPHLVYNKSTGETTPRPSWCAIGRVLRPLIEQLTVHALLVARVSSANY